MKSFLLIALLLCPFLNSNADAQEKQTGDGSWLKASINGTEWKAEKMVFDKYPSEIVQIWGDKGSTSLRLQLNKPARNKIDKLEKTDMNSWTDENFNMYGVAEGEIQTTKMDDQWIEGTFHVNLKDNRSGKTATVTSGSFRIPNPKSFK